MENASKALIIAGAILISILLITIGILVYNASMDPINEGRNQMSAHEISMFNKQFDPYQGERVKSSDVKQLLSAINSSNSTNDNSRQVALTFGTADNQKPSAVMSKIQTQTTYKVECVVAEDNNSGHTKGLIYQIKVTANS